MLLVKLIRSKLHVNALGLSVTVPGNSIHVTINRLTDTAGVHLTKVNFSTTNLQNDPVCGIPLIDLVKVELDVDSIRIHHLWS